jgi:aminoglycoside 3'-phosphotransferase II
VVLVGESGARVVRWDAGGSPALFLKSATRVRGAESDFLSGEAARLRWMRGRGLPVPDVLHHSVLGEREWLLTGAVPGIDAAAAAVQLRRAPDVERATASLVGALAEGLRLLHATDVGKCPFQHPAAARIAEGRVRADRGLVDEGDFDASRRGWSAVQVVAALETTRPARERAVLTHGDYCLPNVMVRREGDGWALSGFVDCGRAGAADPYQDLALAARSVDFNLGSAWVQRLFEAAGVSEPDPARLEFYALLDELF